MTRTKRSHYSLASLAALGTATLFLASCANPLDSLAQRGAEAAIEKLVEDETGGKVDLNTDGSGGYTYEGEDGEKVEFGSSAQVPDTWPDLPLPEGELVVTTTDSEVISLTYSTTAAHADRLLADLDAAGFKVEESTDMGEIKVFVLAGQNDKTISISWLDDGGSIQLQYIAPTQL